MIVDFKRTLQEEIDNFIGTKKDSYFDKFERLKESIDNPGRVRDTTPGPANLDKIASVTETAFQRGIFNSKEEILLEFSDKRRENVKWADLELPVTFNDSPRRKCVDLIGIMREVPFVCELKFARIGSTYKGDRPEYGIVQLLTYYYLIKYYPKNAFSKVYHTNKNSEVNWPNMSNNLVFTANKNYWEHWFTKQPIKYRRKAFDLIKKFRVLNVNIFLFEAEDEDFEAQKNGQDTYRPDVSSNKWVEKALDA